MLQRKFSLSLKLEEMWMSATNHRERGNVPALGEKSRRKDRVAQDEGSAWCPPSRQPEPAAGVSTKNPRGAWQFALSA